MKRPAAAPVKRPAANKRPAAAVELPKEDVAQDGEVLLASDDEILRGNVAQAEEEGEVMLASEDETAGGSVLPATQKLGRPLRSAPEYCSATRHHLN